MLVEELSQTGRFNIFVGAGISKRAPASAPVWKELQASFIEALFTLMSNEQWPAAEGNEVHLARLQSYNFRPETFWQHILLQTNIGFVSRALQVVNRGRPNINHQGIAALVTKGLVENVVTTNFDEYLDTLLPHQVQRIVNQSDCKPTLRALFHRRNPVYFKIHGTISDAASLQFSLKQTEALATWKAELLSKCLTGQPLLIAGYSGYDDDIMPRLHDIAAQAPQVVVVCYPGSDPGEPIRSLGSLPQVRIVAADIAEAMAAWLAQSRFSPSSARASSDATSSIATPPRLLDYYLTLLKQLPVPLIPFLVSDLYDLAGNREAAFVFARLADDACADSRYAPTLPEDVYHRVLATLAAHRAASGDIPWSRTTMDEAHRQSSSLSGPMMDGLNRVFEYFQLPDLTEQQQEEIETSALGALRMVEMDIVGGDYLAFRASWCMGRLRRYQNRLAEAVQFYQRAGLPPASLDEVLAGCYMLDFGLALLDLSLVDFDDKMLGLALNASLRAEEIAVRARDLPTAAKAKMNLTNIYYYCGEEQTALGRAQEAIEYARQSGDQGLQARADVLYARLRERLAGQSGA
jgi:hypothetical protein